MEDSLDTRRAAWRGGLEGELPWMQALACHLVHDRETARELVQDAWLLALKRPPRKQDRPRAWIGTVMRNLVRQVGRRSNRRGRIVADGSELCDGRPQPSQELERAELVALLREELERLGEPYRSTLRDHFERGLSSAEIARRRGVPSGTVRWRLKTGLDRLRARLDEREGGRTRWTSAFVAWALREGTGIRGPSRAAKPLPSRELHPGAIRAAGSSGSLSLVGSLVGLLLVGAVAFRWVAPREVARAAQPLQLAALAALPRPAAEQPALNSADTPQFDPTLELAPTSVERPVAHGSMQVATLDLIVRDEEGAPLAGAELRVATRRGFEPRGTSDASGWVHVSIDPHDVGALDLPVARVHVALRAHARGYAASDTLFVPAYWESGGPIEFTLARSPRVLHGRATDEQGRPLGGVEVYALPDPNHRSLADPKGLFREPLALGTSTDADGHYELAELAEGEQVLCIRRPGEETLLIPTDARESQADLRLAMGGTLRGRILDEHGQPAQGARVWVEPLHRGTEWCALVPGYAPELRGFSIETRTDAEGCYELYGVHPRERRVYACSAADPACVASAIVPVAARAVANWSAFLAREPGLQLRLVDRDHVALSGWLAQLISVRSAGPRWVRFLMADSAGTVSAFEVPSEADLVVYDPTGLGQPWLTRRVHPDPAVQILIVDESKFGVLAGRLMDANGNVPDRAHFEAYEDRARLPAPIRFDPASGRFRAKLQPGSYTLVLRGENGGGCLGRVEIASGERTRMGRVDPPGMGELRLRADRFGKGQGNYRLQVCIGQSAVKWKEGGLPLIAEEHLHAGLYRLDASGADGVLQSGWVRVRENGVAELDLERLPRVLVEVLSPRANPGTVALTVSEGPEALLDPDGLDPDGLNPERARGPQGDGIQGDPIRRLLLSRRSDGRLLHALRLPPGQWRITAQIDSATCVEAWLEVSDGGSYRLTLDPDAR